MTEYYVTDEVKSQLLEYNQTANFNPETYYYPWDYWFDSEISEKIALRDLKRQVAIQKQLLDEEFLRDYPIITQYSDEYYGMWIKYVELKQRYDEAGLLVRDTGYLIADVLNLGVGAYELLGTIKQYAALRHTVKLVGGKQNFLNIQKIISTYGNEAIEALQKNNVITNSNQLENEIVKTVVDKMGVSKKIEQSAELANRELFEQKYTDPPYKFGTNAQITTFSDDIVLVRVLNENSNPMGRWWLRESDIAGLSPMEIKNKFALPEAPTDYVRVKIPAGSTFRVGIANSLYGCEGGGLQFEAYGIIIDPDWIIGQGRLQ